MRAVQQSGYGFDKSRSNLLQFGSLTVYVPHLMEVLKGLKLLRIVNNLFHITQKASLSSLHYM